MTRKSGLGRGLDALIPSGETTSAGVTYVPVTMIIPNPRQPRSRFDEEELSELASSIKEHGVLQPIIVSYDDSSSRYILIAGERRWMAAQRAGLDSIPALLRDVNDQQRVELALIENVQRADLSPLEAAEAYHQLSEEFSLSHEEISTRVGKSRTTITNTLRLLKLPHEVKLALAENKITEGHARALLSLNNSLAQTAALQTILNKDLTVRQTEQLVRKMSGEKPALIPKPSPAPEILSLEEQLRSRLGTRVKVNPRKKGGSIVIHYFSNEELNSLLNLLLGKIQE